MDSVLLSEKSMGPGWAPLGLALHLFDDEGEGGEREALDEGEGEGSASEEKSSSGDVRRRRRARRPTAARGCRRWRGSTAASRG